LLLNPAPIPALSASIAVNIIVFIFISLLLLYQSPVEGRAEHLTVQGQHLDRLSLPVQTENLI
jgi:hypothetical protein